MTRKIIHIDMDAFYASVEQRDEPSLKGQPVIVGWPGERSVVCAASYEARKFGVHSAMPATRAMRLCPKAVFIHPNFDKYRAVSRDIRAIFERHTPLVEPLSLDEAYLDVTQELTGIPTATETAEAIRREIKTETNLTASAGVAPNKFLAKIASDWKKPDGCFVIRPHQVERFLMPLPVRKIPGVGKATEKVLLEMKIETVGDLHRFTLEELVARFGKWGTRLWELARGIDESPVEPSRPAQVVVERGDVPERHPDRRCREVDRQRSAPSVGDAAVERNERPDRDREAAHRRLPHRNASAHAGVDPRFGGRSRGDRHRVADTLFICGGRKVPVGRDRRVEFCGRSG